jgi:CRISPR-associated protein Csm4
MRNYKITWKIRSPLITPLDSDTIFGHLCWAVLYQENEDYLNNMLNETANGKLILSSAFPKDYLPAPFLPEKQIYFEQVYGLHKGKGKFKTEMDFYAWKKSLKKIAFIPFDIWNKIQDSYSTAKFYDSLLLENAAGSGQESLDITSFRNMINRNTGKTGEGNLFAERLSYYKEGTVFESYLKTDLWDLDTIRKYFNIIKESGFGRKKSVGRGNFDIEIEPFDFAAIDNPNAHLVLSNMIPSEDDPTDSYWKGQVKFGKLGGLFANTETPFKYPFYHFLPGTVFISEKAPTGSFIPIHPDKPEIVQNLLCYSIPFIWEGKDD